MFVSHIQPMGLDVLGYQSQLLKRLKGTNKLGLVFSKGCGWKLSVYVDSDDTDKANDRRSMSGVAVMLEGIAVSEIASSTTQH